MVIPHPNTLERAPDGAYRLTNETTISAPPEIHALAQRLQEQLRAATGLPLPLVDRGGHIELLLAEQLGPEAYQLHSHDGGVRLSAGDRPGLWHGVQTLLQLLPPQVHRRAPVTGREATWEVPAACIEDAPRFRWRG